ncbi:mph1p [Saccharomyces arboricola H-6]|uniref:ATP-dependent DNA helicase n=1 Tax=Saccharomyces arboricola (strain H-6 / AS 2.3317 / CBS 10644) TaxID=1160507 RepID=J8PMB6_SACAR|nr:mph1p [Saccharomyces arboricola H-6]
MASTEDCFSDFEDDELDKLYEKAINKTVQETITRRVVPVQRDLHNSVLPGQKTIYEEIQRDVSFGPTHHELDHDALSFYVYPTNYEVRDYQYTIVYKSLFQNTLCAIPTGMGKTFIASTVMLNYFRWTKKAKIIFTAPTRPLVAQQIKACLGITGIPSDQTAILLDKSRKNREEIWANKRVFFATPQVVENDLKRGVLDPKDVVCLVIDEAHRATGSYAYTNVVKFIDRFNSSYRLLALTATPASDLEGVQEVVNNLNISKIEIRTEESIDIVKYMKKRTKEKIEVPLLLEIEDIIEQLGIAVKPVLRQAVELGIYEECDPSQINAFKAMQQSQKIIANPTIPEGIKWRNFFILQLLNNVGQMLKRLKIYGIRTFFNYFQNKCTEFTTKYNLKKSTNKTAAEFYYHPILKNIKNQCERYLNDPKFVGHGKLQCVKDELMEFFQERGSDSRVIIFTELRESALEIVKFIDSTSSNRIRPHIFIGQARAKEGFDEVKYTRKHAPKGRKKTERLKRQEEDESLEAERRKRAENDKFERSARRTGSSEEAQISGMNQKVQKEVIHNFKKGEYNVLVCTSIGEEGLDIGEVDLIICYDTTSSPIKNIQRMGRTGRKRDGKIVLLFSSNESYKFERAMEDYSNLQGLISKQCIDYKKSDRIIPENIIPECRKVLITINDEDEVINEMEDVDEVIRYATQCMMGKKPKANKTATRKRKVRENKKAKKFFMPGNVETSIVSASSLLNKFVVDINGGKQLVLENANSNKKRKVFKALDNLENDSTEEASSSLETEDEEMSDNNDNNIVANGRHEYERKLKPTADIIEENIARSKQLSSPSMALFVNDYGFLTKSEKKIKDTLVNQHDFKTEIKGTINENDFVLTADEKDSFSKHYVPESTSFDVKPNIVRYTKSAKVPHCQKVLKVISLFDDERNDNKKTIIDMNYTKCLARSILRDTQKAFISEDKSQADKSVSYESSQSLTLSNAELDDILGSDSDF